MTYAEAFMKRAIAISRKAIGTSTHLPFGCVIVRDGAIVGEGLNHSLGLKDPTSHGEVEAIRDACRRLETVDLSDCELYTSAEPCALCVSAMALAGIETYYYGASSEQAEGATAPTHNEKTIDPLHLRREAGASVRERKMRGEQRLGAEATSIIEAWAAEAVSSCDRT